LVFVLPQTLTFSEGVGSARLHAGMAFVHEEEDDHNTTDERKEYGAEDRYSSEPQKAHLIVIVAKFGGHALHHFACRPANVVRQGGRQTKNLVLAIFKIRI